MAQQRSPIQRATSGQRPPAPPRPPRILYILPVVVVLSALLLLKSADAPPLTRLPSYAAKQLSKRSESHLKHGHGHANVPNAPSFIPYHDLYVKLPPWLGITLLILWLIFLFSFLGIVASDFFCPNLSTLASRLGLPEDVAGATMVGWANGAPDLFSTFASLKAGSGSLAIGELLGAASFICSVVAGSMVLVKPFRVGKYNFFRDVGFFTVAVAFALFMLRDGKIHRWEAGVMCGLYGTYVVLVAGGSWWRRRRWRKRERERLMRDAWRSESSEADPALVGEDVGAYTGNGHRNSSRQINHKDLSPLTIPSLRVSDPGDDYFSNPGGLAPKAGSPSLSPLVTPSIAAGSRKRSASITPGSASHPSRPHHGHSRSVSQHMIPSPSRMLHRSSILGAIEFRDVVNSLQAESTATRHLGVLGQYGDEESPMLLHHPHLGHHASYAGRTASAKSINTRRSTGSGRGSGDSYGSRGHRRVHSAVTPRTSRLTSTADSSPSQPFDTQEELLSTSVPDLAVDDPWKNAPPSRSSNSQSATPIINVEEVGDAIPQWSLDENVAMASEPAAISDEAGASDITARPEPTTSAHKPALSRFPSKARRLLGLAEPDDTAVPPKAQRLLGLAEAAEHPEASSYWWSAFSWRYFFAVIAAITYAVFPSLHNFRSKSFLNKVTSIISVPAILVLNLTLPVVDESEVEEEFLEELEKERLAAETDTAEAENDIDSRSSRSNSPDIERLGRTVPEIIDDEEHEQQDKNMLRTMAVAHELHSPVATHHHPHSHHLASTAPDVADEAAPGPNIPSMADLESDQSLVVGHIDVVNDADLTRYLTAIQCLLAPIFAVLSLLGDDLKVWYIPAAVGVGLVLSSISILFFKDERHVTRVLTLCAIGFFVAIVWILSIVNEVVGVLQTVGHVFGLSDAILGLTIFAMGNSLGDLVANVTVAKMGYPLMALSACFGGPMLNILLGIGISGTYLTAKTHEPVSIEMSTTLFVSGISLLAVLCGTLITVPLNGFVMSRRWAVGLIAVYVLVMSANIIVEIRSE